MQQKFLFVAAVDDVSAKTLITVSYTHLDVYKRQQYSDPVETYCPNAQTNRFVPLKFMSSTCGFI